MKSGERIALRDAQEEGWWLFLQTLGSKHVPHLGAEPLVEGHERGWWLAPNAFDPVTSVIDVWSPPGREIVGYSRTHVVEGYPEALSEDEYRRRAEDDDLVGSIYEAVYEPTPPTRTPVEGPWLVLDGEPPPPDDGRKWTADLPWALRTAPQYRHLFPGRLEGFREHVAQALAALGDVTAYPASGKSTVTVYVKISLPRLEPVAWQRPPSFEGLSARERRRARERYDSPRETTSRSLEMPVPSGVEGANLAEARRRWDEMTEQFVSFVRSLIASPCPTCQGRGFVEWHREEEA